MNSRSIFTQQQKPRKSDSDELEIFGKPNRITKFIEVTKWYWYVFFLVGSFIAYFVLFSQSIAENSEKVYTIEQQTILLVLLFAFILLVFAWGLKIGANIYRPRHSYLSAKQLRKINKDLHQGKKITLLVGEPGVLDPKINSKLDEIKRENGNGNGK